MQTKHRQSFDDNIISEFNKARQIMKSLPSRFPFFIQALINQKAASFRRQSQARHGLEVPPLLIISITKRCMLNCKGCYLLRRSYHKCYLCSYSYYLQNCQLF